MDCEKFDQHVIDALYEELDELTAAALKRHTEGCTRCAQIYAGLKNAREAAVLPLVEPSPELEERILAAERAAVRRAPWYFKVMRGAAWAGSLAMRPQLAMAALFMLVVGSSLLLLRARPGTLGAPVSVTQRGEPGPADQSEPQRAAPAEGRAAPEAASKGAARDDGWGGKNDEREKDKIGGARAAAATEPAPEASAVAEAPAAPPAPAATMESTAAESPAAAGLARARQARSSAGCGDAAPQFDAVAKNYPKTEEANEAKKELADCQRELKAQPAKAPAAKPAETSPQAPPPPTPTR